MALKDAKEILKQTSRTFYPSIISLPPRIREAVTASYLCLRAIDEIEDHAELPSAAKVRLLRKLSRKLQQEQTNGGPPEILKTHRDVLPEVTLRLDEWLALPPKEIRNTVRQATALMSERMAYWVERGWLIGSELDLDHYTFCVAGAVGVLLSDLWTWYDETPSCRQNAIAYGRGLQAVNILRNRTDDLARGVDFFPRGWTERDFFQYARSNLRRGDAYVNGFASEGAAYKFCSGPQSLAHATLDALERGKTKLTRNEVLAILGKTDTLSEQTGGEEVVLVDRHDQVVGTEKKLAAHQQGALHRAFSVFILNSSSDLLIQRRTTTKYHSRGLWSNTCCGHPRPNEPLEDASERRLREEMGFGAQLTKLFHFIYRIELEDGLIEHEFDHVLVGYFDGLPNPNHDEVSEWRWIDVETLREELEQHPESYTYWFRLSFNEFYKAIRR
jgi:farnesyl-diphosphate farnesyltransferase